MAEHKIKIKKMYYDAVLSGEKTFEIRKNDRDYKVGDIIHFVPIADNGDMIIPHNPKEYKITYVFHGGEYGLENRYCVFGIAPAIEKKMDDLISRSALMKDIIKRFGCRPYIEVGNKCEYVHNILDEQPTIEAVPVVHGEWKECDWLAYDWNGECVRYQKKAMKCSNCSNAFKKELLWKHNFCPNCGTKMEGGAE